MDTNNTTTIRIGAYTAINGAVTMIIGAALWGASGADLDRALASGELSNYLTAAGAARQLLVANLTLWIIGVFIIGVAGTAMANLCVRRPAIAQVAQFSFGTSVPLVIAAYVAWLAIVVQVAPVTSPAAVLVTKVFGWFASRADWVATILIIGIGPALISLAGRGDWVPTWLARWSIGTAIAGLLTAVAMLTGGSGLSTYGFLIIPAGVGWMLAAGIVLLRRIRTT